MLYKKIVKSILGDEVYEALQKTIVKLKSSSVVDITEMHDALQVAPKSIIAFLMKHLADMKEGEAKEIDLPWRENAKMLVNKITSDNYKGNIVEQGKIVHEFENCSIPQLAAHLLSHFELYDESINEESSVEELLNDKSSNENTPIKDIASPIKNESPTQEQSRKEEGSKEESKKVKSDQSNIENIKKRLETLESKINALILLAAGTVKEPMVKSQKNKITKTIKALKKGGLANIMPRPPRPGKHSGSQKGITKAGMHGNKTPHSDFDPTGGQTQTRLDPNLRSGQTLASKFGLPQQPQQPKQPKQPKISLTLKSESSTIYCPDCGQPTIKNGQFKKCMCFNVMSDPKVQKSENKLTLYFNNDWDFENRLMLWQTLKKITK